MLKLDSLNSYTPEKNWNDDTPIIMSSKKKMHDYIDNDARLPVNPSGSEFE